LTQNEFSKCRYNPACADNVTAILPSVTTMNYPVVYFIHGYDKNYQTNYGIFRTAFDEMAAGRINKFIMVSVNSSAALGGTFCVNSPVTGSR